MNQQIQQLVDDLARLGVRAGNVLMVHPSLKALGHVQGGAGTVIDGLLSAVGREGTLLMPALSYATVNPKSPVFDVLNTPCCVGKIPETFRTKPLVSRSVHPHHSVCALGPMAAELLGDHHLDTTPCGPHSPFARLPKVGGKVLMLGCGLRPNTSFHAIEELVEPPYLYADTVQYRVILPDRNETTMRVRWHNFEGCEQRYDRIENLLAPPHLVSGKVLAATACLIDAAAMWKAALAALQRNPLHFVDKNKT